MSDVKISDLAVDPGGAQAGDQIELERGGGSYQVTLAQVADIGSPRLELKEFWGASPPAGWRILDGSVLSRTTYASLFAIFGVTGGTGDGTTTFQLPKIPGRRISVPSGGHETMEIPVVGSDPPETISLHWGLTCWAARV